MRTTLRLAFLPLLATLALLVARPAVASWPLATAGAGDARATATVVDSSGNLIVAGSFTGSIQLGATLPLQSDGAEDVFVAKADPSGRWLWATRAGGAGKDQAFDVVVNELGQIFVAGHAARSRSNEDDPISLRFGPLTLFGYNATEFLASLAADGQWRWVREMTASAFTHVGGAAVVARADGTLLVARASNFANFDVSEFSQLVLESYVQTTGVRQFQRTEGLGTAGATTNLRVHGLAVDGDRAWISARMASGFASVAGTIQTSAFVVSHALSSDTWEWPVTGGGGDLVVVGEDLYVIGDGLEGLAPILGANFYVARLAQINLNRIWAWSIGFDEPDARFTSLAADDAGDLYVAGFSGLVAPFFATTPGTTLAPSTPFVAKVVDQGSSAAWEWVRSPSVDLGSTDYATVVPGGPAVAVAGKRAHLVGRFSNVAQFGEFQITGTGGEAFAARLDTVVGEWAGPLSWTVGVPVTPPAAVVDPATGRPFARPTVSISGVPVERQGEYLVWGEAESKLYWLQPADADIAWPCMAPTPQVPVPMTIDQAGSAEWPAVQKRIRHVAGAPTRLEPLTADYVFNRIAYPAGAGVCLGGAGETCTDGTTGELRIESPGFTVLLYSAGASPDERGQPLAFEVVETLDWEDAGLLDGWGDSLLGGRPAGSQLCTVGEEIESPVGLFVPGSHVPRVFHDDPDRNGYVLFERSFYDGAGAEAAYDRATRTGQILPVNSLLTEPGYDPLVVAWYRTNQRSLAPGEPVLDVAWPRIAFGYDCRWPTDADRVIIASELGSEDEGQQELRADTFVSPRIYRQPDPQLPGYNPNDERARLLVPQSGSAAPVAVYALTNGLNPVGSSGFEAHVLLKYQRAGVGDWAFKVYDVVSEVPGVAEFRAPNVVGGGFLNSPKVIDPNACAQLFQFDVDGNGPAAYASFTPGQLGGAYYRDRKGRHWARKAGTIRARFQYPQDASFDGAQSSCNAWQVVPPGGLGAQLVGFQYDVAWPPNPPVIKIGQTLTEPTGGLPDVANADGVRVVGEFTDAGADTSIARVFDPLSERSCDLALLPSDLQTFTRSGKQTITGATSTGKQVPPSLRDRLSYDPLNAKLGFRGVKVKAVVGDDQLLPNILSPGERDVLKALSAADAAFDAAVDCLYRKTRNPNDLDLDATPGPDSTLLVGLGPASPGVLTQAAPETLTGVPKALGTGLAASQGWVVFTRNDDPAIPGPTDVQVIRAECGPFAGDIRPVASDRIFDEQLSLRHTGDFLGDPSGLFFEWYVHPPPRPLETPDPSDLGQWEKLAEGNGRVEVTLDGNDPRRLLSDNYLFARYRGIPACGASTWSEWAGAPGNTPSAPLAQLAQGWIKRVVGRLNLLDVRVRDFHATAANTFASALVQAGERYEGDIAFSEDPNFINEVGLIEAYETVLRRALKLAVDASPPISTDGVNQQLLLASGRIADLYMLLGNEAYADAVDPTIGFSTDDQIGAFAPAVFSFQNQLDSLLGEELALLRGRGDDPSLTRARPIYNRLIWNFTGDVGEVAYVNNYPITDQNVDGQLDEADAKILYPQGHGDAWGHFLSAVKSYYRLLRHPQFAWTPRPEEVDVGGTPVPVDYLDERKFAEAATARARAGAVIMDLTYRESYVADPAGQWQGYEDTDTERAWGVSGWARRAGQGAYLDWVVGNAIVPAPAPPGPDEPVAGIARIDRATVGELAELSAQLKAIQGQLDDADAGLNPLGLADGAVAFDIDPGLVDQGLTHFEQILDRAKRALRNAVAVFDYANQLTQLLRRNQESADDFFTNVVDQEFAFKNRLVELFGTPYEGEIGPGLTYPSGYDGPDYHHFMYVDTANLEAAAARSSRDVVVFQELRQRFLSDPEQAAYYFNSDLGGNFFDLGQALTLPPIASPLSPDEIWKYSARPEWGQRRVPGELQTAISDVIQAGIAVIQASRAFDQKQKQIIAWAESYFVRYNTRQNEIMLLQQQSGEITSLNDLIEGNRRSALKHRIGAEHAADLSEDIADCIPKLTIAGLSVGGDFLAPARCALRIGGQAISITFHHQANEAELRELRNEQAKQEQELLTSIQVVQNEVAFDKIAQYQVLEDLLRESAQVRAEVFAADEVLRQATGRYQSLVRKAEQVLEERALFTREVTVDTQRNRYRDVAFRVFRNDALRKYRAQFDLSARFVYLAATAYDYETNLLGTNAAAGRKFLTDLVRHRSLGELIVSPASAVAIPVAGIPGLADPLARMAQNFEVLKSQLGFNNPRIENNRFSVRRELFRLRPDGDPAADADWRDELRKRVVPDLWKVDEFRRYARPFAPELLGPQPGIVIHFPSTVTAGLNFFGKDLAGGDSAYDPSIFATKVRSSGLWFGDYDGSGLTNTPRAYLFPSGQDVLRAPTFNDFTTRQWRIFDQLIPVPFQIGSNDFDDRSWLPTADTLSGSFDTLRRFPAQRAFHDSGALVPSELQTDSRLIGRSVWNTEWTLVIPGQLLLNDPDAGLEGFIDSVSDILIFFETYGYQGF